jgi:proteasome accessory factor B
MRLVRMRRLLQLLGHLRTGRGLNARALADLCRVSRRTIFRDLDLLRDAGVPLRYDADEERFRIPGMIVLCHEVGERG